MLNRPGYYISPLYNLIVFYGDSIDTYVYESYSFENTKLNEKILHMINNVHEFEYIGEL